jgi:hypothetical protein
VFQQNKAQMSAASFETPRYVRGAKLLRKPIDGPFPQFLTTELYDALISLPGRR